MSSIVHWISWEHITKVLGVLGFILGVVNFFSGLRSRTVNSQPALIAELRGYLDGVYQGCRQIGINLNLDSHAIHTNIRPNLPRRPENGFAEAIEKMPELGKTVTSIGQRQVDLLHQIVRGADDHWTNLEACIDADPINPMALEFAAKLRRQCRIIDKFFPEYIDTLIKINDGKIWKRFRYHDHRPLTYKIFRWTPLQDAVRDYDADLRSL
jgi:hypothetical protein